MRTGNTFAAHVAELESTMQLWVASLGSGQEHLRENLQLAIAEVEPLVQPSTVFDQPIFAGYDEVRAAAHKAVDLADTPAQCVALSRVLSLIGNTQR